VQSSAAGIGTEEVLSPYRVGVPWYDEADGVTYRVLVRLDPMEGWAGAEFWRARWGIGYPVIYTFVNAGYVDAAMEEGTGTKRYRCRDEYALRRSAEWAAARAAIAQRKREATERQRIEQARFASPQPQAAGRPRYK
jgi:hypothetical protein